MLTPADKLTLTDYEGDTVEFDCDSDMKRLYITAFKVGNARSTGASLDQIAAQAIIDHLTQWLDSTKSTIAPTTITRS